MFEWPDVHTHGATLLPSSITVEEAKEVHRSLKLAAGMFLHIKEQLLPKLPATPEKGTDFDTRVVEAYASQSQAEAQEGWNEGHVHGLREWQPLPSTHTHTHTVTLGRALELGHKPTVVSALSAETGQQFTLAGDALKTLDPHQFGKWTSYLALKAAFYEAYVSGPQHAVHRTSLCGTLLLCRHTASLARSCCLRRNVGSPSRSSSTAKPVRSQTHCGLPSFLCVHIALPLPVSDRAIKLCERYARTKGPGTIARPERHPFFQKLAPMIKLHLDKSVRENGFM